MGTNSVHLVARADLTNKYAEAGFNPREVWIAAENYAEAIGARIPDVGVYELHAVEIAAFELYLNRHLMPLATEVHALRCATLAYALERAMLDWGLTATAVTERLWLDVNVGSTLAGIVSQIESAIAGELDVVAVQFETDGIRADGVFVPYPAAVFGALQAAARGTTAARADSPF